MTAATSLTSDPWEELVPLTISRLSQTSPVSLGIMVSSNTLHKPGRQSEGAKRRSQKPNVACESCRTSKVRCLPTVGAPEHGICQRCERSVRKCIFKERSKTKRRKRTDVRMRELEKRIDILVSLYRGNVDTSLNNSSDEDVSRNSQRLSGEGEEDGTTLVEPSTPRNKSFSPETGVVQSEVHIISPWRGSASSTALLPSPEDDPTVDKIYTLQYSLSQNPHSSGILKTLSHFEQAASRTIGAPHIQNAMRKNGLLLAQEAPFLLHAIQAYSLHHLYYLNPTNRHYKESATYHRQRGLQMYLHELNGLIAPHNMDAIFATCMIFAVLAYVTEDTPEKSFVFSDDPSSITWMSVQFGFLGLKNLRDLQPYMSTSIWHVLLRESSEQSFYYDTRTGVDGLSSLFVELCGMDESSTNDNNPYHAALRLCMSIMDVDVRLENFTKFISFPGRMRPEFFNLVRKKDPVALLLVSYWLSRMCALEQWWCTNRVKGECLAICEFLDGLPDSRVQSLLQVPIQACGYIPRKRQRLINGL